MYFVAIISFTYLFWNSTFMSIKKFQKYFLKSLITKTFPEIIRYIRKINWNKDYFEFINRPNWFKLVTSKLSYCERWTRLSITSLLLILLSTALNSDSVQGFRYLPYLGIPCWPQDSCLHQEIYLWIKIAFGFLYQQIEEASDCVKAYRFEGIRFIQLELPHWEVTCGPYQSQTDLSY